MFEQNILKGWDLPLQLLFEIPDTYYKPTSPNIFQIEAGSSNSSLTTEIITFEVKPLNETHYCVQQVNATTINSYLGTPHLKQFWQVLKPPYEEDLIDVIQEYVHQNNMKLKSGFTRELHPLRAFKKIVEGLVDFKDTNYEITAKIDPNHSPKERKVLYYVYKNHDLNFTIHLAIPQPRSTYFKVPFQIKNQSKKRNNPNFKIELEFILSTKHLPEVVLINPSTLRVDQDSPGEYFIAHHITQAVALRGMLM